MKNKLNPPITGQEEKIIQMLRDIESKKSKKDFGDANQTFISIETSSSKRIWDVSDENQEDWLHFPLAPKRN